MLSLSSSANFTFEAKSVKSRGGTVCFVVGDVGDGGAPRGEEACRLVASKMEKSKWSSPSNGHHCAALKCANNRKNRRDLSFFRFPKDQER